MDALACNQCHSTKLIRDGLVFDKGRGAPGVLTAGFQTAPDAMLFKGEYSTELGATVCTDCGYVELRVGNLPELAGAYRSVLTSLVEKARRKGVRPSITSCPRCISPLSASASCPACGWTFDGDAKTS